MRYGISGSCTDTLSDLVTQGKNLLGANLTTGRVLWLRGAWFYDVSTANVISLYDITKDAAAAAEKNRIRVPCASGRTTIVEFPAPGLKFSTGCCAIRDTTTTAGASGSFAPGTIGGAGYEEG